MTSPAELASRIKTEARRLGFNGVGVAPIAALDRDVDRIEFWNHLGFSAGMGYMQDYPARLARFKASFPDAKSLIALTVNYWGQTPAPIRDSPSSMRGSVPIRGRIARYAWGKNYHRAIDKRLKQLERFIKELAPTAQIRRCVDTAPIPERVVAQQAGLGFIGKNTMLITKHAGSWVFLAELIADLELTYDEPATGTCGSCTLCLEACPTGALTAPFQLDARRCIAYLTIEHRGPFTSEQAALTGDWLFGCDICVEICPHNQAKAKPTTWPEFQPEKGPGPFLTVEELMRGGDEALRRRFAGTSLLRATPAGLRRNADLVLAHTSPSKSE